MCVCVCVCVLIAIILVLLWFPAVFELVFPLISFLRNIATHFFSCRKIFPVNTVHSILAVFMKIFRYWILVIDYCSASIFYVICFMLHYIE